MKNMTSHVKMFLMFPHVFVREVTKYLNAHSHVDNTLSVHILNRYFLPCFIHFTKLNKAVPHS